MNLFDRVLKPLNEELAEVAFALNYKSRPPKYPWLYLTSLVASTAITANCFSSALLLFPVSILVIKEKRLRKPLVITSTFSAIVSLPILTLDPYTFISFNFRVMSSTALGLYLASLVGWDGLVVSLKDIGLPPEIALALRSLPSQLHTFLRDLNTLVIARKARSFNVNYRRVWSLLATAVAGLLVKGMVKSQRTSMALKARGLAFVVSKRYSMPTVISVIALGVSVLGALLGRRLV